jgi:hypothetical protein
MTKHTNKVVAQIAYISHHTGKPASRRKESVQGFSDDHQLSACAALKYIAVNPSDAALPSKMALIWDEKKGHRYWSV